MLRTLTAADLTDGVVGAHARLLAEGPVSHVFDDAGPEGAEERLVGLALHAAGGEYDAPATPPVLDLVAEVAAADPAAPRPRGRGRRDRQDLAGLVGGIRSGDGRVGVSVAEHDRVPVLPEAHADAVLAARPGLGRMLATEPGVRWETRAQVRASRVPPYNSLPTAFDAPALSVREYDDVTCLGRQAALTDAIVLPESYRDPFRRRLVTPVLEGCTPWFVRRPPRPARSLSGPYFWLDTHVRDHFGHALTEQVGHLWGWRRARALDPAVKALLVLPDGLPPWTADLLRAGGVPPEDLVVVEQPVRVERLVACSPAYVIGDFAHPVLLDTWASLGAALGGAPGGPERIFVTRAGDKRVCRNADEVEALFAAHGFVSVRPETMPLAAQASLFRGASVVAGFAGSGMFQTSWAARPQHVIAIAAETYPAHNETQIAALLGHRLDLVVCRPFVPRPGRFTEESFHSDYVVDWAEEGDWLREVLASL